MNKFNFEYKFTGLYILIGGLWIIFSDGILASFIQDTGSFNKISDLQRMVLCLNDVVALLSDSEETSYQTTKCGKKGKRK